MCGVHLPNVPTSNPMNWLPLRVNFWSVTVVSFLTWPHHASDVYMYPGVASARCGVGTVATVGGRTRPSCAREIELCPEDTASFSDSDDKAKVAGSRNRPLFARSRLLIRGLSWLSSDLRTCPGLARSASISICTALVCPETVGITGKRLPSIFATHGAEGEAAGSKAVSGPATPGEINRYLRCPRDLLRSCST
jgi:hypothetical protein